VIARQAHCHVSHTYPAILLLQVIFQLGSCVFARVSIRQRLPTYTSHIVGMTGTHLRDAVSLTFFFFFFFCDLNMTLLYNTSPPVLQIYFYFLSLSQDFSDRVSLCTLKLQILLPPHHQRLQANLLFFCFLFITVLLTSLLSLVSLSYFRL
jgi:hypothetical protein